MRIKDIFTRKEHDIPTREERYLRLLADTEHKDAERKRLEPTIVSKAQAYKRALLVAILTACIADMILMITAAVAISRRGEVVMNLTLIASEIVMMLGVIAYIAIALSRFMWERRLRKVGLHVPFKYK